MKTLLIPCLSIALAASSPAVIIDWVVEFEGYNINVPTSYLGKYRLEGTFEADELQNGELANARNVFIQDFDDGVLLLFQVTPNLSATTGAIDFQVDYPDGGPSNAPRFYSFNGTPVNSSLVELATFDGATGQTTLWSITRRPVPESGLPLPLVALAPVGLVLARRFAKQRS